MDFGRRAAEGEEESGVQSRGGTLIAAAARAAMIVTATEEVRMAAARVGEEATRAVLRRMKRREPMPEAVTTVPVQAPGEVGAQRRATWMLRT